MKVRRKPIPTDAWNVLQLIQWAENDFAEMPEYIKNIYENGKAIFEKAQIRFQHDRGEVVAFITDVVIAETGGGISICRADTFIELYDIILE